MSRSICKRITSLPIHCWISSQTSSRVYSSSPFPEHHQWRRTCRQQISLLRIYGITYWSSFIQRRNLTRGWGLSSFTKIDKEEVWKSFNKCWRWGRFWCTLNIRWEWNSWIDNGSNTGFWSYGKDWNRTWCCCLWVLYWGQKVWCQQETWR